MKIFKYPLEITDSQFVTMPEGATILTAQFQNGQLCLWALVNPDLGPYGYSIRIHGTGHSVADHSNLKYIATAQHKVSGTNLVWHVFEVTE